MANVLFINKFQNLVHKNKKLTKEIQGFRTSASQYRILKNVNPKDISNISDKIRQKLGF